MQRFLSLMLLAIASLILAGGCSRGQGPSVPNDPGRDLQDFPAASAIFSDDYTDIDLAALREYPSGDLAIVDGDTWAAAVSLQYTESPQQYIPMFNWLNDSGPQASGCILSDISLTATYRLPKADACYFPAEEDYQVELAVCYMWYNKSSFPWQWEIGVTINR